MVDDTAFERYVLPEIEVPLRVANSFTRNHAEAEDLVQDTLIRADRRIERFRRVVELVDIDGPTYAEATEVLDVPVGTVMSRLRRARSRIGDRLDRAGRAPRSPKR